MSPRQKLRLVQNRPPAVFDDQKTPAEILQSDVVASNAEEYIQFMISQLRQVIGKDRWNKEVPANLSELVTAIENRFVFEAECLSTDAVGDCVQARVPNGGIYHVTKVDPWDETKMPSAGIIISKSDLTHCVVQFGGVVDGVYGGLTVRKPLFIDDGGGLTQTLPTPGPGQSFFVQGMGSAIDDTAFVLNPGPILIRNRG